MASERQIAYYEDLCEQAYVEPEEGYEEWNGKVMFDKVAELKAMVDKKPKFDDEGTEEIDDGHMPDESFNGVYKGGNE